MILFLSLYLFPSRLVKGGGRGLFLGFVGGPWLVILVFNYLIVCDGSVVVLRMGFGCHGGFSEWDIQPTDVHFRVKYLD